MALRSALSNLTDEIIKYCTVVEEPISDLTLMTMTHPGIPIGIAFGLVVLMGFMVFSVMNSNIVVKSNSQFYFLKNIPVVGNLVHLITLNSKLLIAAKFLMLGVFLLIIAAGLFGSQIPERNIATVLTWNLWWSGLIFSILFLGSAWCAVCPWNFLSRLLVHRSLSGIGKGSLNIRVPAAFRTLWPALWMLLGLTWLELGAGVTVSPYATAVLALVMVLMATVSMAIYERGAFCRFVCPVGRTVGAYSQLSVVALRSIDAEVCQSCKTLDCYYGTKTTEPCPSHLVMGKLKQSNYCTACGQCSESCPEDNVGWQVRSPSIELSEVAKPKWDEGWFLVTLFVLTAFHGITMLPAWESFIRAIGQTLGDSGQLLTTFSFGFMGVMVIIAGGYSASVAASLLLVRTGGVAPKFDQNVIATDSRKLNFKILFSNFAFSLLPITFAYHLAHNLNHVVREAVDLVALILNPFGLNTLPLSAVEKHDRHFVMWLPQETLVFLQVAVMAIGFWFAVKIIRKRSFGVMKNSQKSEVNIAATPIYLFVFICTTLLVWMLTLPMTMRL